MAEEKKYKIIIVDDDDFLVDMYAVKFENVGIATQIYKSGASVLEKLKAGSDANLILLDIVMPGMNGIEILRAIRKDKLAEGIPIVMLTNQNDEKNITEATALGVSGYIIKSAATPSEVVAEAIRIIQNSNPS